MQRYLERCKEAEVKSSMSFKFLKRFGWDFDKTRKLYEKPRNFMVPIADSTAFMMLSMSAIILNAAWIGYATDQGYMGI